MNTNVLQKYNRKESKVKKKIELNYFIFCLLIKIDSSVSWFVGFMANCWHSK